MYKIEILVSSDSGFKGEREDLSGKKIKEIIEKSDACRGKVTIGNITILPDEKEELKKYFIDICDNNKATLILTTGGTGFSKRDVMPEATKEVIEKEVPGISEAMRYESLKITPKAMLSRATSGIRKETLIINLPGSPKAIEEMLTYILDPVMHGLDILTGNARECARK